MPQQKRLVDPEIKKALDTIKRATQFESTVKAGVLKGRKLIAPESEDLAELTDGLDHPGVKAPPKAKRVHSIRLAKRALRACLEPKISQGLTDRHIDRIVGLELLLDGAAPMEALHLCGLVPRKEDDPRPTG